MTKVLLVEDDNNLREIFQMRLQAEGYETVTASDGEEGLVVAMKEKPDLIIADIMMPKLSGFEMVENLRSNPDTKNIKVIMMTALGQAEDQARGEKLNVVEYLVKSQVTLEDFARVVKDTLGPDSPMTAAQQITNTPTNAQGSEGSMQDDNTSNNPSAMPGNTPASQPSMPTPPADNGMTNPTGQQSTAQEQSTVSGQVNDFANGTTPTGSDMPASEPTSPDVPSEPSAPTMPPASEPPAAPTEPPTTTGPAAPGDQPATPPTDPTSNAL